MLVGGVWFTEQPIPGPLVLSILAAGILGIRLGIDLSGSHRRVLEAEIGRYASEIDRLAAERDRLQHQLLRHPRSSNRKKP